jgi:vacuolar iron transporter family protein
VSPVTTPGELGAQKRLLERKIRAREFVFGIQDGLLSTVGLLSGVSAATANRAIVLLTGVAAAITGGVSMATGSYLAARTEQEIFEKELLDQQRLAATQPHLAQEALLESLVAEGLDRPSAYRVVQLFSRDRDLLLRTVQEKVLGIGSADISQPLRAGIVMFLSFVIGAAIPLTPLVLLGGRFALPYSRAPGGTRRPSAASQTGEARVGVLGGDAPVEAGRRGAMAGSLVGSSQEIRGLGAPDRGGEALAQLIQRPDGGRLLPQLRELDQP